MKLNELVEVIDLLNVLIEVRLDGEKLERWLSYIEMCVVDGEIEIVDKHHIIVNVK